MYYLFLLPLLVAILVSHVSVPERGDIRTVADMGSAAVEQVLAKVEVPKPCYEDGRKTIGIQVGHWQAQDAPDELSNLRANTGTSAGGYKEWEVMLELGELVKKQLEEDDISVDLMPVTIPPRYCADLFIALHADGNLDTSLRGYKAATPWRNQDATDFVTSWEESYGPATGMPRNDAVSRNMRGYYAFNSRRYVHAIDPETPAAILETGFLTNRTDREFLVNRPEVIARTITQSILEFLANRPV